MSKRSIPIITLVFLCIFFIFFDVVLSQTIVTSNLTANIRGLEKRDFFKATNSYVHNLSYIQRHFGEFRGFKTFSKILDDLGTLLPDQTTQLKAGTIPLDDAYLIDFSLKKEGVLFFQHLFLNHMGITNMSIDAKLLVINPNKKNENENGLKKHLKMKQYPLALLLYDQIHQTYFRFDLWGFYMGKQELDSFYGKGNFSFQDMESKVRKIFNSLVDVNKHISFFQAEKMLEFGFDRVRTSAAAGKRRDELINKYGFNGSFEMLVIANKLVYDPSLMESSIDFQAALNEKSDLFGGRSVRQIGVGVGVNVLQATKMGAENIQGTDYQYHYVLFTEWNVFFSRETGQIPSIPTQVFHSKDPAVMENGDFYLFNTPLITDDQMYEDNKELANAAEQQMKLSDFENLFEAIKERIFDEKVIGFFRIHRVGFANVRYSTKLSTQKKKLSKKRKSELLRKNIQKLSVQFLGQMGFEDLKPFGKNLDLFILESPYELTLAQEMAESA